jgi:uncharacterized membrane protein
MHDQPSRVEPPKDPDSASVPDHSLTTGLGAVGGGLVGAAVGKSLAGKVGVAIGAVAGAIAGGIAGETVVEMTQEASQSLGLGLGADVREIELPPHYSWEELQALSKSQAS